MHEMSLSQSLVELVSERLRTEGGIRVLRVDIEIGVLGHVEPDALAFCLESAARQTALEGARFVIEQLPGRAYCFDCGAGVTIEERAQPCPQCGGYALRLEQGEELRVTQMEIV